MTSQISIHQYFFSVCLTIDSVTVLCGVKIGDRIVRLSPRRAALAGNNSSDCLHRGLSIPYKCRLSIGILTLPLRGSGNSDLLFTIVVP